MYDDVPRFRPNDDHPAETFEAKLPSRELAVLKLPNECHCPSDRALLMWPRDICVPPPIAFPQLRADAGIDLPLEFLNEFHPPELPPKFRAPELRNIDCQPSDRSKLRNDVGESILREPPCELEPLPPNERELSPPKLKLRPELFGWREKNPPDLASERSFILPPFA
jgi:hypothetical protein